MVALWDKHVTLRPSPRLLNPAPLCWCVVGRGGGGGRGSYSSTYPQSIELTSHRVISEQRSSTFVMFLGETKLSPHIRFDTGGKMCKIEEHPPSGRPDSAHNLKSSLSSLGPSRRRPCWISHRRCRSGPTHTLRRIAAPLPFSNHKARQGLGLSRENRGSPGLDRVRWYAYSREQLELSVPVRFLSLSEVCQIIKSDHCSPGGRGERCNSKTLGPPAPYLPIGEPRCPTRLPRHVSRIKA
ncbi:hypothetical protein GQ53DRAFT_401641 [Thozetella sp. PMI_491]|nr:hypothetical protein GQ53DRAFT_401641 [Thozetella sp. PMI_491]